MDARSAREAILGEFPHTLIKHKARQLARQRGFNRHEEEDLQAELMLRVLAGLPRFDASRGELDAFVRVVVETAAAMIARERTRLKRGGGTRAVSLDQTAPVHDDAPTLTDRLTPLDLGRRLGLVPTALRSSSTVESVIASLSDRDQAVCRELMNGTPASAARNLGISRRDVRAAIERIRLAFEHADLDES